MRGNQLVLIIPRVVLGYVGAELAIKFKKGYKNLIKIEFDGNKNTNRSSFSSLNHALTACHIAFS
jgi:hypothetical protein